MLIGITGTFGSGKGETVRGTDARPCQLVCELANKLATRCTVPVKAPAPKEFYLTDLSKILC